MTKAEILAVAKPILFNTEMVQAILDGRKTQTRRVIKYSCPSRPDQTLDDFIGDKDPQGLAVYADYHPGDILWVRETWAKQFGVYWYKAGPFPDGAVPPDKWRPSIHMPKEAARIFLRVLSVRTERLQDITEENARAEGTFYGALIDDSDSMILAAQDTFPELWDSTVKPSKRDQYGWSANP